MQTRVVIGGGSGRSCDLRCREALQSILVKKSSAAVYESHLVLLFPRLDLLLRAECFLFYRCCFLPLVLIVYRFMKIVQRSYVDRPDLNFRVLAEKRATL